MENLTWCQSFILILLRIFRFARNFIIITKFLFTSDRIKYQKLKFIVIVISPNRFFRFLKLYLIGSSINFETDEKSKKRKILEFIQILDSINSKHFTDSSYLENLGTQLELSGWVDSNFQINVSSKFEGGAKLITGLKRKDVQDKFGKRNLYSGFRLVVKTINVSSDIFDIFAKHDLSIKGALGQSGQSTKRILKSLSFDVNPELSNAGFIDNIKVYYPPPNLDESNLDFYYFANFYTYFPEILSVFEYIDHNLLDTLYINTLLNFDGFSLNARINTSNAKKIQASGKFSHNIEFFKYKVQSDVVPKLLNLENVRLLFGKFVIDENGNLVNEFSDNLSSDLVAGIDKKLFRDDLHTSSTGCFTHSSNYASYDAGILLPSLINHNWFHFIAESLAVLVWFKNEIPSNIPILLTRDVPDNVISLLYLLDFKDIQFIDSDSESRVKNLITFSKSSIIIDSIGSNINSFMLNEELLLNLRRDIFRKFESPNSDSPHELFFAKRNSAQRSWDISRNQSKLLKRYGFETVNTGNLSIIEQLHIFNKVDYLLLEGGASFVNLMFMKEFSKILYLTNKNLVDYKLMEYFSTIFKLNIMFIGGKIKFRAFVNANSIYDIFHSSYTISLIRLRKNIKFFLNFD